MSSIKYRVKSREPRLSVEACSFAATASNTTFAVATNGVSTLAESATGIYDVTLANVPAAGVVVATLDHADAVAGDAFSVHVDDSALATTGVVEVRVYDGSSAFDNLTGLNVNVQFMLVDYDI